jgi:hypothetical protein
VEGLRAALLIRDPGNEPDRRDREPPVAILRAATRMNRLIEDLLDEDLLDVALVEAGRFRVEFARLLAADLVMSASVFPHRHKSAHGISERTNRIRSARCLQTLVDPLEPVGALW